MLSADLYLIVIRRKRRASSFGCLKSQQERKTDRQTDRQTEKKRKEKKRRKMINDVL